LNRRPLSENTNKTTCSLISQRLVQQVVFLCGLTRLAITITPLLLYYGSLKLIASSEKDHSSTLNYALKEGKHLLFTPGIYELEESFKMQHPGNVIIVLGIPSLVSTNGTQIMGIADINGITLSGLLLEAWDYPGVCILQSGQS
jgi:hypothetical protein